MVKNVSCDHCGAECRRPVTKVIDGRALNFCCSGCLQVYELLHAEGPRPAPTTPSVQGQQPERRVIAHLGAATGAGTKTVLLPILGMTCANCVSHVERGLRTVPGVVDVLVSLADERATVRFDCGQTGIERMAAAVRGAGYDVSLDRVTEMGDGIA